jgi:D-beta-D-heptose 7-phosphate kinase/D-beta-D-heptose 1-phosphate adenosyltransferase
MSHSVNTTELPWLGSKEPLTIAVVGDIILDEYLDGRVDRISPEAPVPVHLVKNRSYTPGGAANAARNIRLSGAQAKLFSVAGNDEAYDMLKKVFIEDGMPVDGILTTDDRPTIRKTRITTQSQQLVRIDWERVFPIPDDQQAELYSRMEASSFDAILVSDYGKGALPDELIKKIISLGQERKIPVVIDPKGTNFDKYHGATLIKPNHKEACEALGLDSSVERDGETLARLLNEKFKFKSSLVTLGARGMVLVSGEEDVVHRKPVAKEVFDVSGAGDCVAALVTLGLTSNASLEDVVEISNIGAGVVVEKWGTQPVRKDELLEALSGEHLRQQPLDSKGKIVGVEKLNSLLKGTQYHNKRMVFTNGCFDILHAGHLSYLEKARSKGDFLVVGVNSDKSISRIKGSKRPIVSQDNRTALLAGLWCVDFVIVFDDDTPEKLITSLTPQVLTKGADWDVDKIVGGAHVINHGGSVETVELVEGLSTSNVIASVLEKEKN